MNRFRYTSVVTFALWTALAPAIANAQEIIAVDDSSAPPRPFLFQLPEASRSNPRLDLTTSVRLTPAGGLARLAGVPGAQTTRNGRSERGLGRKVFGAVVGAAGGLFAGGYIGAKIEGDRCHCDDPGLMGALIGAPIGAVTGGIVGALYLF